MSNMANLALDGGDPRLSADAGMQKEEGLVSSNGSDHAGVFMKPQNRPMHDTSITFEE